ncbi:MAG: DNA mismatch repair protein MutS, partial [Spirochaetales bacterium]
EVQNLVVSTKHIVLNPLPDWSFNQKNSYDRLCRHFGTAGLKGFGFQEEDPELLVAGILLEYVEENAKNLLPHIRDLRKYNQQEFLLLDETTLRNLELVQNLYDGTDRYTLKSILDHTKTAMGKRLLRRWILQPLVKKEQILERQRWVDRLYHEQKLLQTLRNLLGEILDLERLSARVALDKAHPKDLAGIKVSLERGVAVLERLPFFKETLTLSEQDITSLKELIAKIEQCLVENPPTFLTEGNLIRQGYNADLDYLRSLKQNSQSILEEYVESEKQATGIQNLKVRYNRIIGHYLEVTKSNLSLVPTHFIRRQSLVGGERFTTERLMELDAQLQTAQERSLQLEKELFLSLREQIKTQLSSVQALADVLAQIDAFQSLAYAATLYGYTKPEITSSKSLYISDGRHPVVERHLPPGEFVPNSLSLEGEGKYFALITGPNMAGKSTYLRQTALILIMAQMGSFVPAQEARIGLVDRIFCRVGAQDNLARGESTFLVEMNETAYILRSATDRSLIIMDEVGRGTGTNDGLAIAWAVMEYLLDVVQAKTLFATHYHELTALNHPHMQNLSMAIREQGTEIVFLKKVKEGPSNNSYGIHVAKLAGLPPEVLNRASGILSHLVSLKEGSTLLSNLPTPEPIVKSEPSSEPVAFLKDSALLNHLKKEIEEFPLDTTPPLEALNFLAQWQKKLKAGSVKPKRKSPSLSEAKTPFLL